MSAAHGALAYHNAVVNWADQDSKTLPLNSEEWDTDGFHSTSVNNELMTVPAGLGGRPYFCHASAYVSANGGTASSISQDAPLYILKNYPGTGDFNPYIVRGGQVTPYTAQPNSVGGVAQASAIVWLEDGDTVQAWLYVDNNYGGGSYPIGSATATGQQMSLAIVTWI